MISWRTSSGSRYFALALISRSPRSCDLPDVGPQLVGAHEAADGRAGGENPALRYHHRSQDPFRATDAR